MSYQIIYNDTDMKFMEKPKKKRHKKLILGIILVLFLGILRSSHWDDPLWKALIPGDPGITTSAFQNLTDTLKDGQSFSDAVFTFCDTVIQGANLE